MIIIASNKQNCIKEFEKELNKDSEKVFTIYIDDGLKHSLIIKNDYIVKRTYLTNKNNALDTLIKAFEILPDEMFYCLNDKTHGITIDTREEKEMKENDYYELKLSDVTITPDEMEKFSNDVTETFKKKIAEHYAMNPLIGIDYLNGVTEAAAYGFNYGCQLVIDKIFENAKMPEKKDNHKPNKLTAENKSKLLAMLDTFVARPTPEELENEKVNLTYGELAELIEELFSVG